MATNVDLRKCRFVVLLAISALVFSSCGDSDSGPPYEVVTEVISHETTQEIAVFSPDAEGTWPVVFTFHGSTNTWEDMEETSSRIAQQGMVVISPTYRTEPPAVLADSEQDAECAYPFGLTIAADYGGDIERPITIVGHSLGATVAIEHGLQEAAFGPGGTYDTCFTGAPRPDVIVGITGCYYRNGFNLQRYENLDATLAFIGATDDENCDITESERANRVLEDAGYDAGLFVVSANHFTPIFHDMIDEQWVVVPDAPAGEQTVQIIVDAITEADA